jgi:hypothetical protein
MSEPDQLEPLFIGDAFPVGKPAGNWVMVLSMAMNDLVTLDGKIHDALDNDGPEATYFLRLLCGTLRELWGLFQVADENEQVGKLIDDLVSEAREAYHEVRELFVRPEATEDDPDPHSWAEVHLKDVRDRTYHYPQVDSDERRDALAGAAREQPGRLDSGRGRSSSLMSSRCGSASATSTSRANGSALTRSSRRRSASRRASFRSCGTRSVFTSGPSESIPTDWKRPKSRTRQLPQAKAARPPGTPSAGRKRWFSRKGEGRREAAPHAGRQGAM